MTADPSDLELISDRDDDSDDVVVPTVEFRGEWFAVRDAMSLMPMMRFAMIARRQEATKHRAQDDTEQGQREMEALAALYDLLQQCIADSDWDAFYEHAVRTSAGAEELMPVVAASIAARAARPTRQPSGSPGGRSTTGPSSAGGSSSRGSSTPVGSVDVQHDLEARGRPDLALVVARAREASMSTSRR